MKRYIVPLMIFLIASFYSCYYDSEEALYPSLNTACDTTNVTFSGTVSPLLGNNCLSCHSNATAASFGNNIRLQDYADVKSRAAAVAGSIKHSGTYSPMPKNGGMLKDCLIRQFDKWVSDGMQNN